MNAKDLVQQIFDEKFDNRSNSRDLARLINTLSKTVFGHINRFVFELLQNADDASNLDDAQIDVRFQLLDNYLVFSHNGAHFTASDVMGISGIGNKASEKDKSIEKTGYKGIGFKSVFGSSDYAHILSGDYSFRFDKGYEGYDGSEDYPWQVIPIWTDSPVKEILSYCDPDRVNTIIEVIDRDTIRSEIEKVLKDCQILLFLRRVGTITFYDQEDIVTELSKGVEANGIINLYNNSSLISSWILKTFNLDISAELTAKLNALHDSECPKKLKEASTTKITFAASVKEGQFLPLKSAVLYSYLPTKADLNFPFLINGDFLTNAERTDLMQNAWNEFLLAEIALKQIDWFMKLQETDFSHDVLTLLKGKYPSYDLTGIQKAYNESLQIAAGTVDFIPEQKSECHVSIAKGIIDQTRFTEYFDPELVRDFFKLDIYHGVIDIAVRNQANTAGLGTRLFTFENVLQLIATGIISDSHQGINLVVFFYNRTLNGHNQNWLPILAEAAFILDNAGHIKTPKEIFFPLEEQDSDTEFESLSFIHPDILAHFSARPDVIIWLHQLGVKEPTDIEIFRKAIVPFIKGGKVIDDNALRITRFIFRVSASKMLSEADYEALKSLKVLTVNGLRLPGQVYLSDFYGPEKSLSAVIPNADFLLDIYPETVEEVSEWKMFFIKIAVREAISIEIKKERFERLAFEKNHPESKAYFEWLEENLYYPKVYHPYSQYGQHSIQNFTAIDFRQHLTSSEFSKFFWSKMLNGWEDFSAKCSQTFYYYKGGNEKVPSFVQYYIRNFKSIPCTDGHCYKAAEIFSPVLKNIVGTFYPVADLPASITKEQADFFAFKRSISISECLELLDYLSGQPISPEIQKQIFAIYEQLISLTSERSATLNATIAQWRKTARLLTTNKTFQPITDLYSFSVIGAEAPPTSDRFIKIPPKISFDEVEALCDLLQIDMITSKKLKFVSQDVQDELGLPKAILERSKFLALIYSHISGESFADVLSRLRRTISVTRFFSADLLSLVYETEAGEIIVDSPIESWSDTSNLYFKGRWNSAITLYNLSSTICSLLNFKDMEREFHVIMQSTEQDIYEWLQQKGYRVNEFLEIDSQPEIFDEQTDEIQDVIDSDPFEGIDIEFEETFEEKVKVEDIDFSNITPEFKVYSNPVAASTKEYTQLTSKKVMVDVGRWSENFIHEYFKENAGTFTEINWLNKDTESYLPYDFEVTENGVKRLVEVKGTSSYTKEIVYMSPNEWKTLFEQGPNYTLFRVFGAGTEDFRFERTDNLRDSIEAGLIMPSPIQLMI